MKTAAALALLVFAFPAFAAASAPGNDPKIQQVIDDERAVGSAMYFWYRDVQAPKRSPEGHAAAVAAAKAAENGDPVDFSTIPTISADELAKLLVPKYVAAIPTIDPWGHPYDYRLDIADPNAARVMGVRSAGADGVFQGTTYTVGEYPAAEAARDLTWMDGYFVTWPAKGE